MKKGIYILVSIAVFALLAQLTSAVVTCTPTFMNIEITQGQAAVSQTLVCSNNDTNNSVTIYGTGTHFTPSPTLPTTINSGQVGKQIVLTFSSSTTGKSNELIYFSDGSSTIPLTINVTATSASQTGCQISPSLVSYTQAIQQGTQMPLSKITFSPINCEGPLVLTSSTVSMQGGIITTQGQRPVYISSVVSDGININIDTVGLTTQQTYTSTLNVNAYGKNFQIPFVVTVTSGTTPVTNFSAQNLPTCSVTNTVLNINATYSLICTNIQPDITIVPEIDDDYIVGINRDTSSNQFIWTFKPTKFGNTIIKARFNYQGSPIGVPYKQEVKISSSGAVIGGTFLDLVFTPSLEKAKEGERVIIQVIDNKSGSLVTNARLLVDAVEQQPNSSAFFYSFIAGKEYNLRAISDGYNNAVKTVKLLSALLYINITPESGDSLTSFKIITSAENASILIDGKKVNNPYSGNLAEGLRTIKAFKEGYLDAERNITVDAALTVTSLSSFEEGSPNVLTLSKNTTWGVYYQENSNSPEELLINGTGSVIEITPPDKGIYLIKDIKEGKVLQTYSISGWDGRWFGISIWWYIIGAVILAAAYYIIFYKKSTPSDVNLYGARVNQ